MDEFIKKIFIELWQKIWPWLLKIFEYLLAAWNWTKPYLQKFWDFIAAIFSFLQKVFGDFFIAITATFEAVKPVVENFAKTNRNLFIALAVILALLIYFWIAMLRHASRNEAEWKKTWTFFILITGPIGATVYYFLRKRALEKVQKSHDKVMLSFFTPMNSKKSKEIQ